MELSSKLELASGGTGVNSPARPRPAIPEGSKRTTVQLRFTNCLWREKKRNEHLHKKPRYINQNIFLEIKDLHRD